MNPPPSHMLMHGASPEDDSAVAGLEAKEWRARKLPPLTLGSTGTPKAEAGSGESAMAVKATILAPLGRCMNGALRSPQRGED